jgi:hypothetical protein
MALNKPYKRTVRQFTNGTYDNYGNSQYLLDPGYSTIPQHYIRSFSIIQEDLKQLFEYIEPADQNKDTISLKIHELIVRTCIELEANFTAILKENKYSKTENWNMKCDFCLIDYSHHLSSYKIRLPVWTGENNIREPFVKWKDKTPKDWYVLDWYQIYNKSKHDRYDSYSKATFEKLIDAICGLVAVLSSQFLDEDYSTEPKMLSVGNEYSYNYNPEYVSASGGYFDIKYPNDWKQGELYDFNWEQIKNGIIFDKIDYDTILQKRTI